MWLRQGKSWVEGFLNVGKEDLKKGPGEGFFFNQCSNQGPCPAERLGSPKGALLTCHLFEVQYATGRWCVPTMCPTGMDDSIEGNASTFLIEMKDVAYIMQVCAQPAALFYLQHVGWAAFWGRWPPVLIAPKYPLRTRGALFTRPTCSRHWYHTSKWCRHPPRATILPFKGSGGPC